MPKRHPSQNESRKSGKCFFSLRALNSRSIYVRSCSAYRSGLFLGRGFRSSGSRRPGLAMCTAPADRRQMPPQCLRSTHMHLGLLRMDRYQWLQCKACGHPIRTGPYKLIHCRWYRSQAIGRLRHLSGQPLGVQRPRQRRPRPPRLFHLTSTLAGLPLRGLHHRCGLHRCGPRLVPSVPRPSPDAASCSSMCNEECTASWWVADMRVLHITGLSILGLQAARPKERHWHAANVSLVLLS